MNRNYYLFVLLFVLLCHDKAISASWEKLYSKRSTDCFRSVQEVSSGGFIMAGYTSNYTVNDTDALVLRLDEDGNTLWSVVYNGTNSKEDIFYKVLQTSDGGFVLCGYSKSFGNGENAFYMKLNSSGSIQWVKNWGGSGTERAQDIIQLPNGKYVICGYSTSSPARYYDAFILKISSSGNTEWSKLYGTTAYDDANSIKLLSDGGFITGGQSNNQLYLIRTNSFGDSLWSKTFGTPGVDNIECVNYAQGGNGFILSGSTNGAGSGGDDAYIVRVDSGGNQLWTKTIGGPLNEDMHRIELTDDGYVGSGTSSQGPWGNPNIWLVKLDSSGNPLWQKYFGGENHDHGYSGIQTSDGGYIVAGHTRSFNGSANREDALVINTSSSGNVSNTLGYTTVSNLISPVSVTCGSDNVQVEVEVTNYGESTVTSIPVTIQITGAITQTLTKTLNSSISRNETKTLTFTTMVDMSIGGTFNFHCFTGNDHDVIPINNYFNKSITVGNTPLPPSVSDVSHCGPGSMNISASSPAQINWFSTMTGSTSIGSGSLFTTPFLTSTTTYYVQAGSSCKSDRIPVIAEITAGINPPSVTDGERCGHGTVMLAANSVNSVIWYENATSLIALDTGTTFTTSSLISDSVFFASSNNGTCTSDRIAVFARINSVPTDPVVASASRCGPGTLLLTSTSSDSVFWFDVPSGGISIASGYLFTTPSINQTATYYSQANNGKCGSNFILAMATVNSLPYVNIGVDTILVSSGSYFLDAGSGFTGYLWSTSEVSQGITVFSSGSYCVTVTDMNNCTFTDCSYLDFSVNISQLQKDQISLYPVPSTGIVTLELKEVKTDLNLTIYDLPGRIVYNEKLSERKKTFDFSSFDSGLYIFRLSDDQNSINYRIIID